MQILPVNIKSLAGSVATLANWLTSWAITIDCQFTFKAGAVEVLSTEPPKQVCERVHTRMLA